MLISKKSKEIVDACRFCWMCRHICPIGNATGQERNTARARALTLSVVERGAAKLEGGIIDNVYERTCKALDTILPTLKEQGYEFVTVS